MIPKTRGEGGRLTKSNSLSCVRVVQNKSVDEGDSCTLAPRDFELTAVSDGTYRLDGGAFFGVVPRIMWEKKVKADAENYVPVGCNSSWSEPASTRF